MAILIYANPIHWQPSSTYLDTAAFKELCKCTICKNLVGAAVVAQEEERKALCQSGAGFVAQVKLRPF